MKTLKLLFAVLALCLFTVAASFGADAAVAAPVVPSGFQSVVNWMMINQVIVGMLIVAIYDFICAINPAWANNGLMHAAYLFGMKLAKKPTDAPPAT